MAGVGVDDKVRGHSLIGLGQVPALMTVKGILYPRGGRALSPARFTRRRGSRNGLLALLFCKTKCLQPEFLLVALQKTGGIARNMLWAAAARSREEEGRQGTCDKCKKTTRKGALWKTDSQLKDQFVAVSEVILHSASYRDAVNTIVKKLKQVAANVELLEECERPVTRKDVYDVTGRGGKTVGRRGKR